MINHNVSKWQVSEGIRQWTIKIYLPILWIKNNSWKVGTQLFWTNQSTSYKSPHSFWANELENMFIKLWAPVFFYIHMYPPFLIRLVNDLGKPCKVRFLTLLWRFPGIVWQNCIKINYLNTKFYNKLLNINSQGDV